MKNIVKEKNEKFSKAFNFIENTDFDTIQDGRIDIGDGLWANLETYYTKENAMFEAHRNYIDIQYIISGYEKIGVCDYSLCTNNIPYDLQKDIEFLDCEQGEYIEMCPGDFLILYPNNAHKPCISIDESRLVRKLVIKVPV